MRLALAIVLASAAVASASLIAGGGDGGGGAPAFTASARRSDPLRAHGHVDGLYPGARKQLRVRISNSSHRSLLVRGIGTRVRDASAECTRDYLRVKRKRRSDAPVPAHSRTSVSVQVKMLPTAPDSCQGAVWPLRYRVRARGR